MTLGAVSPLLLLADDEIAITEPLASFLERSGYRVQVVQDGLAALVSAADNHPDLIVLDVLMPRLDGRGVLRRLRSKGEWTPVILLTQIGDPTERALALEEGADDYLNKPFDPRELLARIHAVLRRARSGAPSLSSATTLTALHLRFDRRARRAQLDGRTLDLTPKALALLEYMLSHPDELLTRERLLDAVWGWEYPAGTRTVDTRVAELRRALKEDADHPTFIETVPAGGYRFIAPVKGEG